jgi:hypothetical protein
VDETANLWRLRLNQINRLASKNRQILAVLFYFAAGLPFSIELFSRAICSVITESTGAAQVFIPAGR